MIKFAVMWVWEKFKASKIEQEQEELRQVRKSLNVNEEYASALRRKSYTDFVTKARLQVNSGGDQSDAYAQILLEPCQEIIPNIVESTIVLSKFPNLKTLLLKYFAISAESSNICTQVLESIVQIQFNYQFLRQAIEAVDTMHHSPNQRGIVVSELKAFANAVNPFSLEARNNFKTVQEEYLTVLHHIRSMRKKVTRKVKLRNCAKKAIGVCATTAAFFAAALAAQTLTFILMGPEVVSFFPRKTFRKKSRKLEFFESGTLRKIGEQLDVAAKGTYILDRDFETISRTVSRLHDGVEHDKEIVSFCLRKRKFKFSVQEIAKELKRSELWVRKQVNELEEHVCLCLVTINRARALVIKEMSTCVSHES